MANFACVGFTYGLTPLAGALFTQRRHGTIGAMIRNALLLNVLFALLVTTASTSPRNCCRSYAPTTYRCLRDFCR